MQWEEITRFDKIERSHFVLPVGFSFLNIKNLNKLKWWEKYQSSKPKNADVDKYSKYKNARLWF
jgi:hypothetical protein